MKFKLQLAGALLVIPVLFATTLINAQPAEPVELTQGYWGAGDNSNGQIGIDVEPDTIFTVENWSLLNTDVVTAGGGYGHSHFLQSDGTLWASGANAGGWPAHGQLGIGDDSIERVFTPMQVVDGENVVYVEGSRSNGMFIKQDGSLWGMGHNGRGQIGLPAHWNNEYSPKQYADNVKDVAGGEFYTAYVKDDGTLWAVGQNNYGQLGDGTTDHRSEPYQVDTNVVSVSAGRRHMMYIKDDGTLWATGDNSNGKLGIDEDPGTTANISTPQQVDSDVAYVFAGLLNSFFIKNDETLWGMGSANDGMFGNGFDGSYAAPQQLAGDVIAVAVGVGHTLYITNDGKLMGSGDNSSGQLGFEGESLATFEHIANVPNVIDNPPVLRTEGNFSMLVADPVELQEPEMADFSLVSPVDEDVIVVQGNSSDELTFNWESAGDGLPINYFLRLDSLHKDFTEPIIVDTLGRNNSNTVSFEDIDEFLADMGISAAGDSLTLKWTVSAELGDDELYAISSQIITFVRGNLDLEIVDLGFGNYATGRNNKGQLGNGEQGSSEDQEDANQLSWVSVSDSAVAIAGGYDHGHYLKYDRTLWSFGSNRNGQQLGIDQGYGDEPVPTQVVDGINVSYVTAGRFNGFFIKTDNSLWGMGNNKSGQLGDGTLDKKQAPIKITDDVIDVAGGEWHTLFLKTDGTLWGMGKNSNGELGLEGDEDRVEPVQLAENVKSVAAGYGYSLYIDEDNTLWGMGVNGNGQLGDGTTDNTIDHVQIATNVVWADAGAAHTLFIKEDGTLWGTGRNSNGELGVGHREDQLEPVQVMNGTDVMTAAAGTRHTFFIKSDKTLWATGDNGWGQLGLGNTLRQLIPVNVATNATAVIGGGDHSYVLGETMDIAEPFVPEWVASLYDPAEAEIEEGEDVTISARMTSETFTDESEEAFDYVSAWIGYNTEDTDPSSSEDWTWVRASFSGQVDGAHEYTAELGSDLEPGTYYYASVFILYEDEFIYGGYSEDGGGIWDGEDNVSGVLTVKEAVSADVDQLPTEFSLSQNYPNPFNPTTQIEFGLPETSEVVMELYSITGEKVATLVNGQLNAGLHTISFDGSSLSSGVYIYRIQAGSFVQTRKLTLIK